MIKHTKEFNAERIILVKMTIVVKHIVQLIYYYITYSGKVWWEESLPNLANRL